MLEISNITHTYQTDSNKVIDHRLQADGRHRQRSREFKFGQSIPRERFFILECGNWYMQ